jgi:PadR family transcriptional regulator, regulatory protein PadR
MAKKISLTHSAAVILHVLAGGYQYGFDIMEITGLPSGTVYPALRRMEEANLVRSQWEKAKIAQQQQRPPRKYYQLTKTGEELLQEARKRYRFLESMALNLPVKENS